MFESELESVELMKHAFEESDVGSRPLFEIIAVSKGSISKSSERPSGLSNNGAWWNSDDLMRYSVYIRKFILLNRQLTTGVRPLGFGYGSLLAWGIHHDEGLGLG